MQNPAVELDKEGKNGHTSQRGRKGARRSGMVHTAAFMRLARRQEKGEEEMRETHSFVRHTLRQKKNLASTTCQSHLAASART